jgi:ATP adenylyltransferase
MAEQNQALWAPWRMEYIQASSATPDSGECFLCDYVAHAERDAEHHVIWRTSQCLTLFNSFPYNNGHLMVAPIQHAARLEDLSDDVLLALMQQTRDAQRLLDETVAAQGYNVGLNFGRCAGAGLPGHLHIHIVPRWNGDTNFMAVISSTRVIPEAIAALHARMRDAATRLGLPPVP